MKLTIIVPVYNEEKTIGEVLNKLIILKLFWQKEIIVVDDGSCDATVSEIQKFQPEAGPPLAEKIKNLIVITHKSNQGKGAAIRTGIKQSTGDYILIHDADMEYYPDEIPKLLKPVSQGLTTHPTSLKLRGASNLFTRRSPTQRDEGGQPITKLAVYGSRFMYKNVPIPKAYYFGNKFLTWLTNIFYGTKLTDMETCYKLIPNNLQWHKLKCMGFDIEPEITIHLIKNKIPIIEVPIKYFSRSRKAGKKLTFRDAFSAIKVIVGKLFSK